LAEFHHPKIRLDPVVIKWYVETMHEPQDHVLILMKTDEEIERITSRRFPSFANGLWGRGISG
jgi:hypothetical protein